MITRAQLTLIPGGKDSGGARASPFFGQGANRSAHGAAAEGLDLPKVPPYIIEPCTDARAGFRVSSGAREVGWAKKRPTLERFVARCDAAEL